MGKRILLEQENTTSRSIFRKAQPYAAAGWMVRESEDKGREQREKNKTLIKSDSMWYINI